MDEITPLPQDTPNTESSMPTLPTLPPTTPSNQPDQRTTTDNTPLLLPSPNSNPPPNYASSTASVSMPTNSLAVLSLALSISSWVILFGVGGIAGVILGVLARNEIKNSHGTQGGDGMALAGIIIGAANIVMVCLGIMCFGAAIMAVIAGN